MTDQRRSEFPHIRLLNLRFATIDLAAPTKTVVEQLSQMPLASRLGRRRGNPTENQLGDTRAVRG